MTAIVISNLSKPTQSKEKISQQEESQQKDRDLTDTAIFMMQFLLISLFFLYILFGIWTLWGMDSGDGAFVKSVILNNFTSSRGEFELALEATINLLRKIYSSSNSYYFDIYIAVHDAVLYILVGIIIMNVKHSVESCQIKIFASRDKLETAPKNNYVEHLAIINAVRTTVIIATLTIVKYQWINQESFSKDLMFDLVIIELSMFSYTLLGGFIKFLCNESDFRRVISFYVEHRNIIFFQLLNLIVMLAMIGCAVTKFSWMYLSLILLPFMHNYVKMVIISASATHDWDYNERGVPLKAILSSMYTISRYHLGSVFTYTYFYRSFHQIALQQWMTSINYEKRCYIHASTLKPTKKNSMIITVLHNQGALEATLTSWFLANNGKLNHEYKKSVQSVLWADTFRMLLIITAIKFLMVMKMVASLENILIAVTIFTSYILLNPILYYAFIKPMNTVLNAIQFCEFVKEEDLEIAKNERKESIRPRS